jgi:hypothetical protein
MAMDEHDLQARLRNLGAQPVDPARQSADLTAMAQVRRPAGVRSKLRIAAAFGAGLLLGSSGLAAADALPDPAQHVAHTVLGHVGVDVPNPARYHGPECGDEVKANHGAYVRDDHSLAQSDCGKPEHADKANKGDKAGKADDADAPGEGKAGGPADDGCHGKPRWAGNKSMTPEAKAAAQADRAARCGSDDADDADADEVAPSADGPGTEQEVEEGSTTTTVASTTTEASASTGSTSSTAAP